jgi:probable rRNA maturation factor
MKINIFYNTQMAAYYKKTSGYKAAALKALGKAAKEKGEVNIVFVSGKEILKINKTFLNHNYVTDTIAFNYPFDGDEGSPFGDVFVCFKQARKQAKEQGHGALRELMVLVIHGTLHLTGHDDDTAEKRKKMNARAERIAAQFLP